MNKYANVLICSAVFVAACSDKAHQQPPRVAETLYYKNMQSAQYQQSSQGYTSSDTPVSTVNPTTGLPMVGAVDVQGTPYGAIPINPTTGLPMVGGTGGVDVRGNSYGAPGTNPTTGLPMAGAVDVGGTPFASPASVGTQ